MQTERLLFRPLELSDLDDFFDMNNNPNVNAFLRNPITSKTLAESYIQRIIAEYEKFGIGRYAVVLKENNKLIGFSGLKYRSQEENKYSNFYDLGYRFAEEHWGKGYATEAALFWINYGFETLKLPYIYACAVDENYASNHVLRKVGFTFVNQYTVHHSLHNWYKIEK